MPWQRLAESGSGHASPVASRCPSRVPPSRWSKASSGFAAKAVGEDEAASPRNTCTCVSNNCFGVSMPERWRAARQQVNPSEITYCSRTFQVVPRGLNLCGHRRQWRGKTPPQVLGNLRRSSIRHHEGEPEYRVCQPKVRHRLRTSTSPNSSRKSSDDSRRPIVLDQRSPSYHHMRCYRPPDPTSRLARSRSPAR